MVGKTHGQSQMAKQNQQLTALQEINDRIAQLRKRNKARVQRPQQGERRFGDAPEAVYVEPKPPDPSRINQHPTSQTHTHHVANSRSKIQKIYPRRYLTHGSKEKSDKPIFQKKAKVSPILDKFVYKSSPTGMSHLSLSKDIKTGPEVEKDTISTSLLESKQALIETSLEEKTDLSMKSDSFIQSDLLVPRSCVMHLSLSKGNVTGLKEQEFKRKESPGVTLVIDQKMAQDTKLSMLLKEAKPVLKVSHQGKTNESYKLIVVPKKEPDPKLSHEPTSKWKPKSEQSIVQVPKPMFQGKVLESQKRMKADLLYLGADYTVSRSKPCQEGGDDVVIRSATEPEVSPKPYSTSQGANQDIRALKMPYLTNQEGLNHEANYSGFYTQEGDQANWNWAKILTEQEVMSFTSQRFLSPSICEYLTLEADSSPMKEGPEPKPIIGFKRDLSSFQQAQYQEKWPRNYEVMIQSPKPVKPVLHLPQLEANRFNQLQTRHWRPGDHFNQSGDIIHGQEEFYKSIPWTSQHRIKGILIYFNLPYLESQALKLQQLFFLQSMHDISTFQTIKKIPRKLTYPLKPSRYKEDTIYIHLAKILIIKPPTASFQGAINSFASKFIISIFISFLMSFYDC
ncbi:unnamed protein product [Brassica rapa]|uniref:Uncharacterized protein n=2 Tax=Brassica campestris TaxID=3711 RepID=A0A8D9LT56_BRACM|nr:unnamed protein product [Brassica rapa]